MENNGNGEVISIDDLVEHLAAIKWLQKYGDLFPENLFVKVRSGEFQPFSAGDHLIKLLRHDLSVIANRLTVVGAKWGSEYEQSPDVT